MIDGVVGRIGRSPPSILAVEYQFYDSQGIHRPRITVYYSRTIRNDAVWRQGARSPGYSINRKGICRLQISTVSIDLPQSNLRQVHLNNRTIVRTTGVQLDTSTVISRQQRDLNTG